MFQHERQGSIQIAINSVIDILCLFTNCIYFVGLDGMVDWNGGLIGYTVAALCCFRQFNEGKQQTAVCNATTLWCGTDWLSHSRLN